MILRRCKLSKKLQLKLLENFVSEVTARTAANLLGIQANTAALFYRKIREIIVTRLEAEAPPFAGEVEVDESYFGGARKGTIFINLLCCYKNSCFSKSFNRSQIFLKAAIKGKPFGFIFVHIGLNRNGMEFRCPDFFF